MNFDIKKMMFSIIYSFDCADSVKEHMPKPRKRFDITESNESDDIPGWKHRKLVAILNHKQFEKFLESNDLTASTTPTMGSIGAPGFGLGWAPAILFEPTDGEPNVSKNAYVTPVPDGDPPKDEEEHRKAWDELVEFLLERYGTESKWGRDGEFDA